MDLEGGGRGGGGRLLCVPTTMQIRALDMAVFVSLPSKSGMQVSKGSAGDSQFCSLDGNTECGLIKCMTGVSGLSTCFRI